MRRAGGWPGGREIAGNGTSRRLKMDLGFPPHFSRAGGRVTCAEAASLARRGQRHSNFSLALGPVLARTKSNGADQAADWENQSRIREEARERESGRSPLGPSQGGPDDRHARER